MAYLAAENARDLFKDPRANSVDTSCSNCISLPISPGRGKGLTEAIG